RAPRRSPAAGPGCPSAALVAVERDGLSLQACPDPGRGVCKPHEVGPGFTPRELRRVARRAGGRRAARDPGPPPRPRRISPRRSRWGASGRSRPRSCRHAAGGRTPLARPRGEQAARNSFLRALELEPTLERRYLAAKAAWRLDDLPAVAREMEPVR